MGFFTNIRIANWQAKIAAQASVYLEEAKSAQGYTDTDSFARFLLKVAWKENSRYFHPDAPDLPSVLPLVGYVLTFALDGHSASQVSENQSTLARKALHKVLDEIEGSQKLPATDTDHQIIEHIRETLNR